MSRRKSTNPRRSLGAANDAVRGTPLARRAPADESAAFDWDPSRPLSEQWPWRPMVQADLLAVPVQGAPADAAVCHPAAAVAMADIDCSVIHSDAPEAEAIIVLGVEVGPEPEDADGEIELEAHIAETDAELEDLARPVPVREPTVEAMRDMFGDLPEPMVAVASVLAQSDRIEEDWRPTVCAHAGVTPNDSVVANRAVDAASAAADAYTDAIGDDQ